MSPRFCMTPLIMAAVGEQFCLSLDFSSEKLGPDTLWYNPPDKYQLRCNGTNSLKVFSVSLKGLLRRAPHCQHETKLP